MQLNSHFRHLRLPLKRTAVLWIVGIVSAVTVVTAMQVNRLSVGQLVTGKDQKNELTVKVVLPSEEERKTPVQNWFKVFYNAKVERGTVLSKSSEEVEYLVETDKGQFFVKLYKSGEQWFLDEESVERLRE